MLRSGITGWMTPGPPPGVLLAGFRTQPIVGHKRLDALRRMVSRAVYVRDAPGVSTSIAPERSLFQPVNIPAKVQVDVCLEYSTAYRTNLGYVGYLERTPYVQGQPGQGTMQARPNYPYSIQPPRFSTLPVIFGVGGQ